MLLEDLPIGWRARGRTRACSRAHRRQSRPRHTRTSRATSDNGRAFARASPTRPSRCRPSAPNTKTSTSNKQIRKENLLDILFC